MEGCLLCLEINKDFVDCIKVHSTKWQEHHIEKLIEKHLWILESITASSWICHSCWQALNDFHTFYRRIEEAHVEFGKLIKTEFEPKLINEKEEPDILLDQLLTKDYKTVIKVESDDELKEDSLALLKQSKQKCHSKDMTNGKDPLKSCPQIKLKTKTRKKDHGIKSNSVVENSLIKDIPMNIDIIQIADKSLCSSSSSETDNFDSYTDIDYISKKDRQQSKNTQTISDRLSDSNDSYTKLEYKPKDGFLKPNKLTAKERDTFLEDNFKMSCVLCQIPMSNFKTLTKHFEVEHKERGYAVCCDKKFKKRITLLEHIKRHVEPYDFKCKDCGKVLSSQKSLQNHQFEHLPEEEKRFECSECGNSYNEQKKLLTHIRRVHLRSYEKICDICGKRLRCGEAFHRHVLEHEGKSLPSVSCDICGAVASSKHNLRRHINMQHPVDGKKEYICNICYKVSPNIYALRKHINCTHRKDNVHKCTVCERGFKRPLALREHMATHTGIALYTCPWCPKTFNASGGMHAHRKLQHPVEWEESRRQKILEKSKSFSGTKDNNVNCTDF